MQAETHKVLLVDDRISEGSVLGKQLQSLGFQCTFAHSFEEAKAKLNSDAFELVLSKISIGQGTAYELRPLLINRPISLFYSLAVEQDCWWIPGVRRGKECLGEPALRPDEFFKEVVVATVGGVGVASRSTAALAD